MSRFARLRNHPRFSDYFDAVHPLFWWVLVWQLRRAFDRIDAQGSEEALISVYWWGGIEITYYGDPAPSPSAYRPLAPTRKPWSDPSWSCAVPAEVCPETQPLFCPRTCGGSGRAQSALTKGASALQAIADTS
ncbi:MAG: hypothetical protein ACK4M6_10185 [Hyphomonas sp.]